MRSDAGKKTAEGKGDQFVHGGIDTGRLDGQLVFADGVKDDAHLLSAELAIIDEDPVVLVHRLAREHDALLYLDDAHGFGGIGERGGP